MTLAPANLSAQLAKARRLIDMAPEQAVAALQQIVFVHREHPEALQLLGRALRRIGRTSDGADAEHAAIAASAASPELSTAIAHLTADRADLAEGPIREVLARHPEDVAALVLLAEVAKRVGIYDEAENLYRRAIALAPDFSDTRVNLAEVLFQQNRVGEALALVEDVLATVPDHPTATTTRLIILGQTGEYAQAIAAYEAMLPRRADDAGFWHDYANVLKTVGRTADSVAAFRRAVALDPLVGEAWWGLANLKTAQLDDADIARMEALLERSGLSDNARLHLHFALGKALEDAARYETSFRHYDAGNRVRRRSLPYDPAIVRDEVARTIAFFTPERLADLAGAGCPANDPIFILGMPRAGSTLIEQILASHPLVEGTAELPDIPLLVQRLLAQRWRDAEASFPALLADLDREAFAALGRDYLAAARLHRKTDRPFFIDKLPNNWAYIGFIHLILPNATIIDARREPMACCFSNFKQHFAKGQPFCYAQEDMAAYYRDYVAMLEHFDRVLPERVIRVQHERLLADPETQIPTLLKTVGLPAEAACLRFYDNDRPVRTASAEQVRRPISRSAVDQWRHYAPWLGPLRKALGDLV